MTLKSGDDVRLALIILRAFTIWTWIALFVPVIWKLANKFPIRRGNFASSITMHGFASVVFMPIHAILYRFTLEAYYMEGTGFEMLVQQSIKILVWLGLVSTFSYWVVVAVSHLVTYYQRYQERELKKAHLEAELTQTRMQVLNMQLHPHFLFNTFHNVNTLIYKDVDVAEQLLVKMKKLLNESFSQSDLQEVKLSKEIEFISHYLDIEKTRFSDRLDVDWHIDPKAMHAYVPHFILQPLVENAVRHGVSKKINPATIQIIARKIDNKLQLLIEDEGPGLKNEKVHKRMNGKSKRQGMGISNTRNRLDNMYGDYKFELSRSELGGLKVFIELPYRVQKYQTMLNG